MELKIGQDTGLKKFNQLEDKNKKKVMWRHKRIKILIISH